MRNTMATHNFWLHLLIVACGSAAVWAFTWKNLINGRRLAAASLKMQQEETARFLTPASAIAIKERFGTPIFVYDQNSLVSQAQKALAFPNSFGLKVRFAMKACPNAAILRLLSGMGIGIDASSGYEVRRAIKAGVKPEDISLSSQELPHDFQELVQLGIEFNACSLNQLQTFGQLFPGGSCGVRFNPGKGSGGTGKTNVGGPSASFGIWHEWKDQVKEIAEKHSINVVRIHTHIGSGSDPEIWQNVALLSLGLVRDFPSVHTLNLGGGFKVGRMSYEKSTDLQIVGATVNAAFQNFAQEHNRQIKLEIEPGTFLVANAGALLCSVQDIVSTGSGGYTFIKLDTGMTEVLRPSLYGAQHPIVVLNDALEYDDYIVVGHCCESGDLFTCAPGSPEELQTRRLKKAALGDLVAIEGSGAYCSGMSTKNYNSFPEAPEAIIDGSGDVHLIRKRQSLAQVLENEIEYEPKVV